ncbi:MAG: hypothetical protein MZV64_50165 [Ignavibacteriales bacterium]|nr:hypothetical protein [Ignavibacteriales bacterium]
MPVYNETGSLSPAGEGSLNISNHHPLLLTSAGTFLRFQRGGGLCYHEGNPRARSPAWPRSIGRKTWPTTSRT